MFVYVLFFFVISAFTFLVGAFIYVLVCLCVVAVFCCVVLFCSIWRSFFPFLSKTFIRLRGADAIQA